MKKALIAGAASVALAAMPVVGVFAATSSEFTDTLNVNVKGGCTLENSLQEEAGDYSVSDRTFDTVDIAAGTVGYINADGTGTATETKGKFTISCNTSDASKNWTVSVAVTDLTDGATPTAHVISGGVEESGPTSNWAIKSNAVNVPAAGDPFASYAAAANGTFLTAASNVTGVTFNPSYKVYIAPSQTPNLYTGSAKYTINLPQ